MTVHSILAPSSAARRVACPGSRALEALYPQKETDAAQEGTLAHQVAENALHFAYQRTFPNIINDFEVTEEMRDGALLYAETLKPLITQTWDTETRLNISRIHPECFGTVDFYHYSPMNNILHVVDYKFGHGFVEVFENWQLIEYAAGLIDKLNIVKGDTKIVLMIIQPRSFHSDGPVRTWETTYVELSDYFERLKAVELKAMMPDALCTPSPECKYCSAKHACTSLQASALVSVDIAYQNRPHDLTPRELGSELRILKAAANLLDARINGLEAQAIYQLQAGQTVPFFTLEPTQGRENWTIKAHEVAALGALFGVDLMKEPAAITPKQAIKAGLPAAIVSQNSASKSGPMRLVSLDMKKARRIFG